MAMGTWIVSSIIRFSSNGVSVMNQIAGASTRVQIGMDRLTGKISAQTAAYKRLSIAAEEARAAQARLVTNVSLGVAGAGIGVIGYAVDQAAKLQTVLISIQNATGASQAQLARYGQRFYDIGDQNGMTVTDVADITRVMARASGGRMSLDQLMGITPYAAQFAMIMKQARGEDYETSATQAITLAHMFRAYDPKSQGRMFDAMAHLGEMMPHNLNAAITQMGYFLPKLKTMGIDDSSAIAMMAWMDQSGYGRGKGGTGLRSLVEQGLGPLQLTSHAQAGKAALLKQMGLIDDSGHSPFYDVKKQAFDIFGYLGAISDWVQKQPRKDDALKTITGAFGSQGGNIASLLADPQLVDGLKELRKFATDQRTSQHSQAAGFAGGATFQIGRAGANFISLMTEIGGFYLPEVTNGFKNLASSLHTVQAYLHGHRDVETALGRGLEVVTGIAAVVGSVGLVTQGLKFLGILRAMPNALTLCATPFRLLLGLLGQGAAEAAGLSGGLFALAAAFGAAEFAVETFFVSKWGRDLGEWIRVKAGLNGRPTAPHPTAIPVPSHIRGGGFGTPGTHIDKVSFEINGVTDPKQVAMAVNDQLKKLMKNPRSIMSTNSPTVRTHPNVPFALSTQPGFG